VVGFGWTAPSAIAAPFLCHMLCPGCHHLNADEAARCTRCGRQLATPTVEIGPGQRLLGRYQLGPMLGEGAAGQVFQAYDELLGRKVALKVLNRELWQSPKARTRMAREAAALGRVTHPHVVGIYNVFEHESALVLELEFVEGGTLSTRLRSGPLPLSDALRMMGGILSGLGAIHRAGIVHRDLKPANILLTRDGMPKLADLGVARDTTAQGMTRTGTQLGTVEYMSPEQIRGDKVGPATDVYACGILLYELLSGSVPFDSESEFGVMSAQLEQAPDLARLEGRAPPAVVQAVARALRKAPQERWPSAREFAKALGKAVGRRHSSGSAGPAHHRPAPSPNLQRTLGATLAARMPRTESGELRFWPIVGAVAALLLFLVVLLFGVVAIGYIAFGGTLFSH
jgi:serine/threonine protein kinase